MKHVIIYFASGVFNSSDHFSEEVEVSSQV